MGFWAVEGTTVRRGLSCGQSVEQGRLEGGGDEKFAYLDRFLHHEGCSRKTLDAAIPVEIELCARDSLDEHQREQHDGAEGVVGPVADVGGRHERNSEWHDSEWHEVDPHRSFDGRCSGAID